MNKRGFTLIELLVVISIISFLASSAMVLINSSRIKARDAKRKADLIQIVKALDLYFEKYGFYPSGPIGHDVIGSYFSTDGGNWIPGLQEFLPKIPRDPINNLPMPWGAGRYSYSYGNVGGFVYKPQYDLTAQLESATDPDRCAVKRYKFYFDDSMEWCGSFSGQIYEVSQFKSF